MTLKLMRIAEKNEGTSGVLFVDGLPAMVTLELSWKNNRNNISCIPIGKYRIERMVSMKFGETFEVMQVPNRSGILFHSGNSGQDTHGCILVGLGYTTANSINVGSSKLAHEKLMSLLRLREYDDLEITSIV